ncbi:helix-turn-helix transcriptional regulator [Streptomyces anulatus]
MSSQELADFLRRREDLRPEDVPAEATLPPSRRARRTPGLRREEVAALAQVSVSYYERLEQARAPRPSPQVLSALATALQLTGAERDHLARRNLTRISTRFRDTLRTGVPGSESDFSQQAAAQLRAASVRYPTDNVLAELINEFATRDPDFASRWCNHTVRPIPSMRKYLHHPTLGELEIDRHTLSLPGSGFSLVMYTAEAGSPGAAALKSI